MRVEGQTLKVGDTIEVWWRPQRDTITALRPYSGPANLPKGTQLAEFALLKVGMTILPDDDFTLIQRSAS